MNVKTRQQIERRIASRVIKDALKAGLTISVHDGEAIPLKKSTDRNAILAAMFSVDEEHLILYRDDKRLGTVFFVYGNDGWDAICDHSLSVQEYVDGAFKLANEIERKHS